jgi:hypothetical protein
VEYVGHARSVGRFKRGIEALEADRRAFREERYSDFVATWEKNEGAWTALLNLLFRHAVKGEDTPEITEAP